MFALEVHHNLLFVAKNLFGILKFRTSGESPMKRSFVGDDYQGYA
jgi:hypothetical protein